jgi:hypothetical protein
MTKHQEMGMEIAYWVEEVGYADVVDALISACQYWATAGDEPPIQCSAEQWAKREQALRWALRETERP